MKKILDQIKFTMKNQKIRQHELSKQLEISPNQLSNYLNEKTQLPLDLFEQICSLLKLNPSDLIELELSQKSLDVLFVSKDEQQLLQNFRILSRSNQMQLMIHFMKQNDKSL